MPKMPNPHSAAIATALKHNREARAGSLHTDGRTVTLHGNPILIFDRIKELPSGEIIWSVQVSFAGWVTSTTTNNANSVLSRMGSVYRIGKHNDRPYIYRLTEGGKEAMRVRPDQWVIVSNDSQYSEFISGEFVPNTVDNQGTRVPEAEE